MSDAATARSYGKVFDSIAAEYDRNRPGYPSQLVEHAIELAGLRPGDAVLELGCGTGQLTRSLVGRGLRVTAVEPGENLIALAEQNLGGNGAAEFINARLEDAELPQQHFRAAFAAASFHWLDPDVSWRRVAEALTPGGTFALIQYFGLDDARSANDQAALTNIVRAQAPELAPEWGKYRDLDTMIAGVEARSANVSEVWSFLGGYELARPEAAELFEEAQIAAVPIALEHSAGELNAVIATMSFWARLSPAQREAITAGNEELHRRLGRPIRSSTAAVAVTARRSRAI
jgi:cyclopropane fatty-acyl-phospholipid synthase-like methyltransferase